MQQQVLVVTPVALYEVVDGRTEERGNCACAIVAFPSSPPKYSLVCYNDKRETLCVASISSSNDHGLQLQVQTSEYASFRDSRGRKWSFMFLKSAQVDQFLAVLGMATYSLAGTPTHTTSIADFAPPTNEVKLGLTHRTRVRYAVFAIRRGDVLQLGELLETNGDKPYNFQPVQSSMALLPESKGFEASVLGMSENSRRAVVVPATMPRSGRNPYGTDSVVFVVQVVRILHVEESLISSASVPTVLSEVNNALVPAVLGDHGALVPTATPTSAIGNGAISILRLDHSHRDELANAGMRVAAQTVGSGIPAEHMAAIQKVGVEINTGMSAARDIHDTACAVSDLWKQTVNRPKPSALTNAALEQSVKQLLMDNERVEDELQRRDELLRLLDQRNRDLQRQIDTAAVVSQQLMDEKHQTVTASSDSKLERDRTIMKIQEQISQSTAERDDVQRHLQTVKKLLEVADEELRDIRSKTDIHNVQAQSIASKLDAMQDALGEERARRKGLEAKVATLLEEISKSQAEVHLKAALLEDLRRKADAERTHQAQIMEDERQRRSFEAQQLRNEIVEELQLREQKFLADRGRVAEDNFKRGQMEGKEIGRREARIDVETQIDELRLESQRAQTELSAYKTQLRTNTEEAMASNRRLESDVAALKRRMDDATRKKVQNEFQAEVLRANARCAKDNVHLALTSIAHRLTRPVAPENLVALVEALRDGKGLDFAFQDAAHLRDAAEAHTRRAAWIEEDFYALFGDAIRSTFQEWLVPLCVAHEQTVAAVRQLWTDRDGTAHYDFNVAEMKLRFAITQEVDRLFDDITSMYEDQCAARLAIVEEVRQAVDALLEEHSEFLSDLQRFKDAQQDARAELTQLHDEGARAIALDEADEFREIVAEHERAVLGEAIAQQGECFAEEERARASITADEAELFDSTAYTFYGEREVIVFRQQFMALSMALSTQESVARMQVESAEISVWDELQRQLCPPRDPTPDPPAPPPEESPVHTPAVLAAEESAPSDHSPVSPVAEGDIAASDTTQPHTSTWEAPAAIPTMSDVDPSGAEAPAPEMQPDPECAPQLATTSERPSTVSAPPPKRSAFDDTTEDSSDDDATAPLRKLPAALAPKAKMTAPARGKMATSAAFADSSSDDDSEASSAPARRPQPAARQVAPKPQAKRSTLFDSSDDE